jgi:hypothetical protein
VSEWMGIDFLASFWRVGRELWLARAQSWWPKPRSTEPKPPRGGNTGGNRATLMVLPLEPTEVPAVYRRGSKFVVVYRAEGRQRKQSVDTLAEARVIKLQRDGAARAQRRGPTLHAFSLSWLDRYAGSGHDSVRANTRREYRRLLVNFALTYFDREVRVRELDRVAVQQFVDWLTARPGRAGRLCDRSIANTLTPLRLALDAAVADGLLDANPAEQVVLPRRRAGRAWSASERRYLTPRRARARPRRGSAEVAAAVRAACRDRAADLRGDRAALERPRPRRAGTASAGAPRDRQRRNGRAQVSPRRAADPADARAGRRGARSSASQCRRRRVRLSGSRRRRVRSGQPAPPRAHPRRRVRGTDRRGLSHPPSTRARRCSSSPD